MISQPSPNISRRSLLLTAASVALSGCAGPLPRLWPFSASHEDGYSIFPSRPDDTLVELARDFELGFVEFAAANQGVDPWVIPEGTPLRVAKRWLLPEGPREGLLVNIGDMRVYLFDELGGVRHFPIGIGRDEHVTPLGATSVRRKQAHPTWYPPSSVRAERPELPASVPPGPDNPLGDFALYLGWPSYLIHGTNIPWSVGRRASNGCLRLYPEHIERLFAAVDVGLPVTVVDQPVKIAWQGERLMLEAHPSQAQATEIEETGRFSPRMEPADLRRVATLAGDAARWIDWPRVHTALLERRSYPIQLV